MRLASEPMPGWPKLVWLASFAEGSDAIEVHHGPRVETGADWCVEAVWAGEFAAGDFDATDLVFGTGIRCRGDCVIFVSAGTMLDRLWHCKHRGCWYVSNSLPAILSGAGLSLSDDYLGYAEDIKTMRLGLHKYKRTIPTDSADMHVAYYHNLLYDGRTLKEVDKPNPPLEFGCYADYRGFLLDTARRLQANLEAPTRRHRIVPLASVSSGYDSGAAAAIAREAGCKDAVTIANASSLFPRSDSGEPIAKCLGLECRTYRHTPRAYRHEEAVWAAAGQAAGLNLTIFDYPQPLCLFFTGYRGDSTWCRAIEDEYLSFATIDVAGLGMCEFRLIQGIFHCPVPCWGSRNLRQIQAINFQPEMEFWTLHNAYDRPIPRRILEEAGVPRNGFATRKEVTAVDPFFAWPFTRKSVTGFARFLRERGFYAPSPATARFLRGLAWVDQMVAANLGARLNWRPEGFRSIVRLKGQDLLFQWANAELRTCYQDAPARPSSGLQPAPQTIPDAGVEGGMSTCS